MMRVQKRKNVCGAYEHPLIAVVFPPPRGHSHGLAPRRKQYEFQSAEETWTRTGRNPVSSLVSSQRRRNVRRTAATGVQGKTVERNPNGGGSQDRGCHLPCRLGSAHNGALWQQVDCLAHVGQTSAHCKVRMLALCAFLIPSWMYFSRHDGCAACSEISACAQWRLRWDNSSYARDGALASRGTTSAQPGDA